MLMTMHNHTKRRRWLGLSSLLLLASCTPKQRDFSQLKESDAGSTSDVGGSANSGGRAGAGTTHSGGDTTARGGSLPTAGTTATGGGLVAGGPSTGGVTAAGGALAVGGTLVAGGTFAAGGVAAGGRNGGAPGTGGTTIGVGGRGGTPATGGAAVGAAGGSIGIGGVAIVGGTTGSGGISALGGVAGTIVGCITTGVENCTDGVDNDCNGTIDCPVVTGRYPEPGGASAGDDAWAQLQVPLQPISQVECRSGKPSLVGSKPWTVCDRTNLTALKVYSMGAAEAAAEASNGVTQFDFRFVYVSGKVSDPRSIAYYAHNSLIDTVPGTPVLACPVLQPDSRYFEVARPYVAPTTSTTTPTFAAADVQLKAPFIFMRFAPKYIGDFVLATTQQEVKLLSLRHRFVVDSSRQMLLVTRSYKALRGNGSCEAAVISDHDSVYVASTNLHYKQHLNASCDAIVLNRAGSGVCLGTVGGVLKVVDPNTSKIIAFIRDKLKIEWPSADPVMWHKLTRPRSGRGSFEFFSPKCFPGDLVCLKAHPGALIIPAENGDPYFTGG